MTTTQYEKIDPRDTRPGDEILSLSTGAGEWIKVANASIHESHLAIEFEHGGTKSAPLHHWNVRRAVVEEETPKTVTIRKTVDGSDLKVGDVLHEIGAKGCSVTAIRPHAFQGEVDHLHVELKTPEGNKAMVIALTDDRFDVEREDDRSDRDAAIVAREAWERVVEDAIETEEQSAADAERRPSMVNVRQHLAQQVVGERAAKEFAVEQAEYLARQVAEAHAERDEARAELAKLERRLQDTLDAVVTLTGTVRRDKMHTPDTRARLISQLYAVQDIAAGK